MVGPKLEDTIDSYLVGVVACLAMLACLAGLRDHAIRLMKRRRQHGLRTCCDGQRTNVSAVPHRRIHLSRRSVAANPKWLCLAGAQERGQVHCQSLRADHPLQFYFDRNRSLP